jgi:Protein of unknown function (DUF2384)
MSIRIRHRRVKQGSKPVNREHAIQLVEPGQSSHPRAVILGKVMLTEDQKSEIRDFVQEVLAGPCASSSAATASLQDIVAITARAIEVLGTREKVLRWLQAPVRSLGNQTPLSLLNTRQGITRVEDALGRMEHGVW